MAEPENPKTPSNVSFFPGVTREHLPSAEGGGEAPVTHSMDLTSEMVLRGAIEEGIEDVVVLGFTPDGEFYLASESADIDAVIGKLTRAAAHTSQTSLVELEIDYEED